MHTHSIAFAVYRRNNELDRVRATSSAQAEKYAGVGGGGGWKRSRLGAGRDVLPARAANHAPGVYSRTCSAPAGAQAIVFAGPAVRARACGRASGPPGLIAYASRHPVPDHDSWRTRNEHSAGRPASRQP